MFCIQYNGLTITDTPRECAGLARVFVDSGLDKILRRERRRCESGSGDGNLQFLVRSREVYVRRPLRDDAADLCE
jgi:hypothetical protein